MNYFTSFKKARPGAFWALFVGVLLVPALVYAASTPIAQRRLTNLLVKGSLILHSGDYITNSTDDMIDFQGAGGADDTDLRIDLDGTHPVLSSTTDLGIEVAEPLGTTHDALAVLAGGAATFAVTSNVMTIDCDGGGNSITTITGGVSGQLLFLIHVDTHCTYVDADGAGAANTIDLLGANIVTAADEIVGLLYDGTRWREFTASIND